MKRGLLVLLLLALAAGIVYFAFAGAGDFGIGIAGRTAAVNADQAKPGATGGQTADHAAGESNAYADKMAVSEPDDAEEIELRLVEAFDGEKFEMPVGIRHAGDGSNRLFVVEKTGRIAVTGGADDGPQRGVFLDIGEKVNSSGGEQGLLGLAFHPDFAVNGKFYVNYTNRNGDTVVEQYTVDPFDPNRADAASGRVLLEIEQPYGNHNGGELAFGPDGCLYIATGDGGSGGDPQGNAQNLGSLLGKILRIDVDRASAGLPYAIPEDNPFRGNAEGFREEIYAYGLRNPWRFSFDRETGRLWAADVGQSDVEEIDIVEAGGNYGWNRMEGGTCFRTRNCDRDGLVMPIWEYAPEGGGASITGGFVYRGGAIPALRGHYLFADFVDGRIWTLAPGEEAEPEVRLLGLGMGGITSFGEDEAGELYAALLDGKIMRLAAAADGAAF